MLNLNAKEQGWLDEYRRQLEEHFPGLVEDILFYGPYARGVSDPDIDMCSLVLIKKGSREIEEAVATLGDKVDLEGGFFVAPFIKVSTIEAWQDEKRRGYSPFPHVTGDGISAL